MEKPVVAVVILNYNGKKLLQQFVPSVLAHSQTASVYVIDNASTDDSVSFLEKEFPQIKIILNRENSGFAEGYNIGLNQIAAPQGKPRVRVAPNTRGAPKAKLA